MLPGNYLHWLIRRTVKIEEKLIHLACIHEGEVMCSPTTLDPHPCRCIYTPVEKCCVWEAAALHLPRLSTSPTPPTRPTLSPRLHHLPTPPTCSSRVPCSPAVRLYHNLRGGVPAGAAVCSAQQLDRDPVSAVQSAAAGGWSSSVASWEWCAFCSLCSTHLY